MQDLGFVSQKVEFPWCTPNRTSCFWGVRGRRNRSSWYKSSGSSGMAIRTALQAGQGTGTGKIALHLGISGMSVLSGEAVDANRLQPITSHRCCNKLPAWSAIR